MVSVAKKQIDRTVYQTLIDHYNNCFDIHGSTARGVDWPNEEEALIRHHIMQSLWREDASPKLSVLDLGCGFGAFFEYLSCNEPNYRLDYYGIDLSEKMIHFAEAKYPKGRFEIRDIFSDSLPENAVDYGVMNGVLTLKKSLTQEEMTLFAQKLILELFKICKKGIAFNCMTTHVNSKRDDLFHLSFQDLTAFVVKNCSRHFIIRHDYDLYDYTFYLYKNPSRKTRR